jgi:hypothetical protein
VDLFGQFRERRERQRDADEGQQQPAPASLQQPPGATPERRRMRKQPAPVMQDALAPDQAVSPP